MLNIHIIFVVFMINASGNGHVLFVVVVGGYGVVNSVCAGFLGSAMGLWTNTLSIGRFRAKSKPRCGQQKTRAPSAKIFSIVKENRLQTRTHPTEITAWRPASSDTAGLSASIQTTALTSSGSSAPVLSRTAPAKDTGQIQTRLEPSGSPRATESSQEKFSGKYNYLEIQVSHSSHEFRLYGLRPKGDKEVLYETKVGLGSGEFPTPVGVYYVTHIYDDDPWWIPPRDRAWAAGQSPSRKVYGGTMAPLLKKRTVRSRRQPPQSYDLIDAKVRVDDYGYRFHGTNQPRSIGHNQSHGCVRMIPNDARKVASLIKEYVGIASEKNDENGKFVVLRNPVRLNLVK